MTAPEAGLPVPFKPYGLVSLWEIMWEYNNWLLVSALSEIECFEYALLGHTKGIYEGEAILVGGVPEARLTKVGLENVEACCSFIDDDIIYPLDLVAARLEIENIKIHSHEWSGSRTAEALKTLRWKVERELQTRFFLHLRFF